MILRKATTTVLASEAGIRLDWWLARRFTYHTRQQWQRLVRNGSILINGDITKTAKKLRPNDTVEYRIQQCVEPQVTPYFTKIYEDAEVLLVNKPANLPCHPSGKFFQNTLWYLLKSQLDNFWIINRLDRETSGIVILAKSINSARLLSRQFGAMEVVKNYLVLVEGSFPNRLKVQGYLVNDPKSKIRKQRSFTKQPTGKGDYVLTYFHKVEECNGLSYLKAIPKSGKLHQIRASLYAMGFPVVGDKIYGCVEDCYLRFISNSLSRTDQLKLRINRQALHAHKLQFRHPTQGTSISVTAPVPAEFQEVLNVNGFSKFPMAEQSCGEIGWNI